MRTVIRTTITACLISLMAANVGSGASIATVQLLGDVAVKGPNLALADVAKVTSKTPAIAARLKEVSLGTAPFPGQTFSLTANQIRFRMKAAKIDASTISFIDPGVVTVSRASQKVTSGQLVDAAKDAIMAAWTGAERIECEATSHPQDINVKSGKLELASGSTMTPRPGVFTVPIDIKVDGSRERTTSVSMRVKVFAPVVVTVKAVSRGQMLEASDLTTEERDLGTFGGNPLKDIALAVGMRMARGLSAGSPVRQTDVEVIPLVHRSGPVVITATAGRVKVRSTGTALEEGLLGQLIKVRPSYAKEAISCKVIGDGAVELAL